MMKNENMTLSIVQRWLFPIAITAILFYLTYFLGYRVERHDFTLLLLPYCLFFASYLSVYFYVEKRSTIYYFAGLGILLRILLIFAFPNLSDDIYRFIWDGHLWQNGINPFDQLPSYYIEQGILLDGLDQALYDRLNSPNYFTIYPPINQLLFALSAYLSPNSWWGSSVIIKSSLCLMEAGSIWLIFQLLPHFQQPLKNGLLYALNPLLILEIIGNVHFEGAMVFFFLLGIWCLVVKKNIVLSGIAIALSISSKLLPLIFLPFFIARLSGSPKEQQMGRPLLSLAFWQQLNWRRTLLFFGVIGITLCLLFLPLFSGSFVSNFGASLNLYFQKFEFNASIYYILRWLGFQYKGYNIIHTLGPWLSLFVFFIIILKVLIEKNPTWQNIFESCLFAISIYLFFATTIHPWYVVLPLVCCLFTQFRFPIFWSGLIFLTYINYSYPVYQENLWVVAIEYILVGIFVIYELFYLKKEKVGNG